MKFKTGKLSTIILIIPFSQQILYGSHNRGITFELVIWAFQTRRSDRQDFSGSGETSNSTSLVNFSFKLRGSIIRLGLNLIMSSVINNRLWLNLVAHVLHEVKWTHFLSIINHNSGYWSLSLSIFIISWPRISKSKVCNDLKRQIELRWIVVTFVLMVKLLTFGNPALLLLHQGTRGSTVIANTGFISWTPLRYKY